MSNFLDFTDSQILLLDGAMGTQIQGANLTLDDFQGQENCSEILNLSRPDFIRNVHRKYFAAGRDAVETNTFGGSTITLGEFGLEAKTIEINKRACELAHEAIAEFAHDGRKRFVIGAIGPGTKLPSLGHIDYDALEKAFLEQAEGLLQGNADAILVETAQDPLQVKTAVNGAKLAMQKHNKMLPIMVQVTVETTGTLLVGSDIAAASTIIEALGADVMGLNCATGPQEMADHVRWLSHNWPRKISVLPNAGLPELHQGHVHFPLSPNEMAKWMERFLKEDGINIIGGCCGTNENHIAAINAMLEKQEAG